MNQKQHGSRNYSQKYRVFNYEISSKFRKGQCMAERTTIYHAVYYDSKKLMNKNIVIRGKHLCDKYSFTSN